jgi:hypothetical protein
VAVNMRVAWSNFQVIRVWGLLGHAANMAQISPRCASPQAKVLARRVAANIAKLPALLQRERMFGCQDIIVAAWRIQITNLPPRREDRRPHREDG